MDHRYRKKIERFWQRQEKRVRRHMDSIDIHGWFDYWHAHPAGLRSRRHHPENQDLAASTTVSWLRAFDTLAKTRTQPIQVFATLCDDPSNNAVWLHSPSPNKANYPHTFDRVEWEKSVPGWVADALEGTGFAVGAAGDEAGTLYVVCRTEMINPV
ncbi:MULTISPECIES: hypothetical protein [Luteibacter]|uniref:hypothetical protein n=1 Tax=Luteibacter TaxID=242605 RepID=UPI000563BD84|nr:MULTISPECIES: hypothetical protein [unclassified Luteibacter]